MPQEGEEHYLLTTMTDTATNNKADTSANKAEAKAIGGQLPGHAVYRPGRWSCCHAWIAGICMSSRDAERVEGGVWGDLLADTLWVPM